MYKNRWRFLAINLLFISFLTLFSWAGYILPNPPQVSAQANSTQANVAAPFSDVCPGSDNDFCKNMPDDWFIDAAERLVNGRNIPLVFPDRTLRPSQVLPRGYNIEAVNAMAVQLEPKFLDYPQDTMKTKESLIQMIKEIELQSSKIRELNARITALKNKQ